MPCQSAADWANRFWSAIGHIGTEDTSPSDSSDHREDSAAAAAATPEPAAAAEHRADSAGVGGAR